eukprot:gnl/TRDRNA2_/TRDRNA2_177639_c6_seq9.p1 gnl/TRDRNA2_/TRDRNA2_177639_c6~~gnl/TRDRNA2_/TRDRNA2_177639_c6_seq9.p1  ORF type:complete len:886 (+),score=215.79 gnl/TRDRNA2_/TRDRNA2_177639_c6_seq9:195-2660(+)
MEVDDAGRSIEGSTPSTDPDCQIISAKLNNKSSKRQRVKKEVDEANFVTPYFEPTPVEEGSASSVKVKQELNAGEGVGDADDDKAVKGEDFVDEAEEEDECEILAAKLKTKKTKGQAVKKEHVSDDEAKTEGRLDSDNSPDSDEGTMVEIKDDVKDEKKFELKDELKYELNEEKVKTEVKLELNPFEVAHLVGEGYPQADVERELRKVMERKLAAKVQAAAFQDVKDETKSEVKEEEEEEPKSEVKQEVKEEVKEEDSGAMSSNLSTPRVRLRKKMKPEQVGIKREVKEEPHGDQQSKSFAAGRIPDSSFAARVPYWIKLCLDFQVEKRTWHPGCPCCLPNLFLSQPTAPPRDEVKLCWERLTKDDRRKLRSFVQSDTAEECFKHVYDGDVPRWQRMLHPERYAIKRPGVTGPRGPQNPIGNSGLKEWPWMRDLPKRMWMGKGWMLLPEGLVLVRGISGIPGTVEWEGLGEVKVSRHQSKVASTAGQCDEASNQMSSHDDVTAGSDGRGTKRKLPSPGGSATTKKEDGAAPVLPEYFAESAPRDMTYDNRYLTIGENPEDEDSQSKLQTLRVSPKQSGIPGVCYDPRCKAWRVNEMVKGKRKQTYFVIKKYLSANISEEDACQAALKDAAAFRKKLVDSGRIKVGNQHGVAKHKSGIKGVVWIEQSKAWQVTLKFNGKNIRPKPCDFSPKDSSPEAVEEARLLAVEARRKLEGQYFKVEVAVAPEQVSARERPSGHPEVFWHKLNNGWRACLPEGQRNFKPRDGSPQAVEDARLAAVEAARAAQSRTCKKGGDISAKAHRPARPSSSSTARASASKVAAKR